MVAKGYKGLPRVTMGDMSFPRVTKLTGVYKGYSRLQEVTGSYRGCKRLQRVTRGHKS